MSGKGPADTPVPAVPAAGTSGVAMPAPGPSERRLLTALSYDLVGSTDLLAQSDVEDFHELILAFQEGAREAITSRGGSLMELGDGGLALFPPEVDAKDAASLAIQAGLQIVSTCARVGREKGRPDMHVRVGVATSMALVRGSQPRPTPDNVTGIALAIATRLQAVAEPDTVIVSQQTRSLARRSHSFSFQGVRQIKGLAEPERVWRAFSHKHDIGRFYAFGRLNTPMVGRTAEMREIGEVWHAVVEGHGGAILIEGEAGIGKSRLLHEVRRMTRRERRRMLLFQCAPGGARSTLHPMLQSFPGIDGEQSGRLTTALVAELFGRHGVRDTEVVDLFSYLLGADGLRDETLKDARPEVIQQRISDAVLRGLQLICADGPVVIAVEDVHWVDPTSRHLLTEVARHIDRHPALLVLTGRPESTDEALELPLNRIPLDRLDSAETREAIAAMWPQSRPADFPVLVEVMDRVTAGLPLFIEEICQWMGDNAGFVTDQLAKAASPGTTSVLDRVLSARLEPLGQAREVARAAAVIGLRFNLPLLCKLLPELEDQAILDALDRLGEAGLLVRTRPSAGGFYFFRHALIQEAIYNAALRATRRTLHGRLVATLERDRETAAWIGTAVLADHAERAGLIDKAIAHLAAGGKESSARSAMAEARHLLEHALRLCDQIDDPDKRDAMKLSALAALGPVLTSTEGPGSARARQLYEDGVEIARRRPVSERASLFPIYWGWWFTGTAVDNKRAQAILSDMQEVEDPEVQLQVRHCIWAIDFYLGRHESCIAAVDAGMPLYGSGRGGENFTLFGGHDAKVCGLSHRGLSEWLTGRTSSAIRSISEARQFAEETGHAGSIAHAYYNEAMLHCYRRDFDALRSVVADIRTLTEKHSLRSLAATTDIFEGWCEGNAGRLQRGQDMIRAGLAVHAELQTPEDHPVYCGMLAELMAQTGDISAALDLLSSAATEAEESGHRYWLAELQHRRARLLLSQGAPRDAIVEALAASLEIASEQNAVPLVLGAYDTLLSHSLSPELEGRYRHRVDRARATLEEGEAPVVSPETSSRRDASLACAQ